MRSSSRKNNAQGKIAMKRRLLKTSSNALILSIGLHLLLFLMLGTLYRQRTMQPSEPSTTLVLEKTRPRIPLRRLKRRPHLPIAVATAPRNMQPTKVINVRPTSLQPSARAVLHRETTILLQTPGLPTPAAVGYSGGGASPVPGFAGKIGNGIGTGVAVGRSASGGAKRFLMRPNEAPVADIAELTLPALALTKIGRHIVANRTVDKVDIVFVIDGSGSMKNDINAVREHLSHMTDLVDAAQIDFTLGIVAFRAGTGYTLLGMDFEVIPQTRSIARIQKILGQLRCSGDEKALDALVRAADEVRFRRDADVHFILVTDEYVSGAYSSIDVLTKMKTAKIRVDVIGRDEPSQKFLAKSTGGLWLPISSLAVH